jgi:ABC-type phosphate transport system ATPase subunit
MTQKTECSQFSQKDSDVTPKETAGRGLKDPAIEWDGYSLISGYQSPLHNVSFSVAPGESVAIIGPAGSGKSMLLAVLSQMIWEAATQPQAISQRGLALVLGEEIAPGRPPMEVMARLRRQVALVSEHAAWLPLPISENFEISSQFFDPEHRKPFADCIEDLPLSPRNKAMMLALAELLPSQIEPPLLQELSIIRALLRKPKLLLLDEPFVRMDPVLTRQNENLILQLSEDTTCLWATNDLHQASRVTDWTLFLLHGQVVEFTPTAQFFTNPKQEESEHFIAGRERDC